MASSSDQPGGDTPGAWIFVSHSHRDLAKVRRIRDALEARGHNPLLFFLKCLGDDVEVDDLIQREIEARTWFILCDSENARTSRWVQSEVALIKRLGGKVYEIIDLDGDLDDQLVRIDRLSRRATVFLSYSQGDELIAEKLREALRKEDYAVFDPQTDLKAGSNWALESKLAVERAMAQGALVILLTHTAIESSSVERELQDAVEAQRRERGRGIIVPVLVDLSFDRLPESIKNHIEDLHFFQFRHERLDADVDVMVAKLISFLKGGKT